MEKNNAIGDMETTKNLINELREGRELAHQLRYHLSSSSSSQETKEFLAHKILSTYEKSITILSPRDAQKKMLVGSPDSRGVESPNSEDSDHDRGSHTCTQSPNSNLENPLTAIQEPNDCLGIDQNQQNNDFQVPQELENVIKDLRVITQDLDVHGRNPNQELPGFPSSLATGPEKSEFMTHLVDSSGMFSENFASGANYGFPMSPSFGSTNFTSSAENVHEVVSTTTSATNSPTLGFDFPFGNMGFDSGFTFGNPGGFSS